MPQPEALPTVVADLHVRIVRNPSGTYAVHVSDVDTWHERTLEPARTDDAISEFCAGTVGDVVRQALAGHRRKSISRGSTLFRSGMNAVALRHQRAEQKRDNAPS